MAQRLKSKQREAASRPANPVAAPPAPAPAPARFAWTPKAVVLVAVQATIIILLALYIYTPSLHGKYLWDDDFLIQNNDVVHSPEGLAYIWSDPQHALIDFFPLTVSFEWLIWQVFPPDPNDHQFINETVYYHSTSLILHCCNALLIWFLFRRLGIRFAWLGALIFTVHPVIVESVGWMAELKNTVAMPPFLLAVLAWLGYDRTRRWEYYVTSFVLYVIALLCKTSVVAFPVVILLYDWWKHGKIGYWNKIRSEADFYSRLWKAMQEQAWNILPTIPFFIVACADAYFLIIYLRHGVGEQFIPGLLGGPLGRTACAGLSLIFYFSKCILPLNLMPIYTQWPVNPPPIWDFIPWPVMAFGFWWLLRRREQPWARVAIFGFGFFFINLFPFVGWRAISFMRFQWVMDHFLYVPILGLCGLAAAAVGHLDTILPRLGRIALWSGVTLVIILFTVGAHRYDKVFVDRLAYWTYETQRNWVAWPAHNNRGNQLLDYAGQDEQQAHQLHNQAAAAQSSGHPQDAQNLELQARALMQKSQALFNEAEEEFKIALVLNPVYTEAYNNLGFILSRQGHYKDAEANFRKALSFTPDFESAQINLQQVLQLESAETFNERGVTLAAQGQYKDAEDAFRQALQSAPQATSVQQNLNHVLAFEAAQPHYDRGLDLLKKGNYKDAIDEFQQTLQLAADYPGAQAGLADAMRRTGGKTPNK